MVPLHPVGMHRSVEYDSHKNLHPVRDASLQDAIYFFALFLPSVAFLTECLYHAKDIAIIIFNPECIFPNAESGFN